jgi:hypothetical protein
MLSAGIASANSAVVAIVADSAGLRMTLVTTELQNRDSVD